ncbi:MAG: hypothetical protein J7K63_08715 [Candidatus Marinimicrobia bacterium]|nr:hypothetical protein [Candidatus Neomarinimicrobiota bacterium]
MKYVIKSGSILLLSLFLTTCDDDSNSLNSGMDYGERMDYEIYRIVVSHTFPDSNAAFVLRDSTVMSSHLPEEILDEYFTGLEEETVVNYYERGSERIPLKHIPGFPNCILSRDFEGEQFQYPDVTLSAIGYNDEKTQALVETGILSAPLVGAGYLYFLEYEEGTWVIKKQLMIWIS